MVGCYEILCIQHNAALAGPARGKTTCGVVTTSLLFVQDGADTATGK